MGRSVFAAVVLCLACSGLASAQVTTIPVSLGDPVDTGRTVADLETLTQLYGQGEWNELQKTAKSLIDAAKSKSSGAIKAALDPSKHYLIVTWLAADPFGKPLLARVIVHNTFSGDPFSNDLPGVGVVDDDDDKDGKGRAARGKDDDPRIYQVFFSRGTRGKIASVYASTRDKDPFLEELPAFVQAIASPLFAAIGTFAGPTGTKPPLAAAGEPQPKAIEPPPIFASVASVSLPFRRATVKWKAMAKEPVEAATFNDDIEAVAASLTFAQPSLSVCARGAITPLLDAITKAANDAKCAGVDAKSATCRTLIDQAIIDEMKKQAAAAPCTTASKDDLAGLTGVEKSFREFVVDGMTNAAEADITFKNRPLTHWSFGAGSGVLSNAHLSLPRVKVGDDVLAADPLGRVVTTTFVNWSPPGYDPERAKMSPAERARLFFGVTITPDFGLTGGGNILLARGIGVTIGGVLMFSQGAELSEIGSAPPNPDKPYRISYTRGLLFGISYNFK